MRPVVAVQVTVPHRQLVGLVVEPSRVVQTLGKADMAHWLASAKQKRPEAAVHVVVPQLQCLLFSAEPSVVVHMASMMLAYPMGHPVQKDAPGGLMGTWWGPAEKGRIRYVRMK